MFCSFQKGTEQLDVERGDHVIAGQRLTLDVLAQAKALEVCAAIAPALSQACQDGLAVTIVE